MSDEAGSAQCRRIESGVVVCPDAPMCRPVPLCSDGVVEFSVSAEFVAAFKARGERARAALSAHFPRELCAIMLEYLQRRPHLWQLTADHTELLQRASASVPADGLSAYVRAARDTVIAVQTRQPYAFDESGGFVRCWSVTMLVCERREVTIRLLALGGRAMVMTARFAQAVDGLKCWSFAIGCAACRRTSVSGGRISTTICAPPEVLTLTVWADLSGGDVYVAVNDRVLGWAVTGNKMLISSQLSVETHGTGVTVRSEVDYRFQDEHADRY